MKISKVDHRRTAVGKITEHKIGGFIYQDPNHENKSLSDIVNERANATKILFNIFNNNKIEYAKKSKDLAKNFNISIRELAKSRRINNSLTFEILSESLISNCKGVKVNDDLINEILDIRLKKSFRNGNTKAAVRKLLEYISGLDQNIDDSDRKLIEDCFIKKLIKEYSKSDIKTCVPDSIKNQNMVVQYDIETKTLELPQVSQKGGNAVEKKAFKRFLSEYAVLDDSLRHRMRLKLRRIVNLYFYGSEAVNEQDFDEWKDHELKKSITDGFVEIVKKTVIDSHNNKKEGYDADVIRDSVREKNIMLYRRSVKYVKSTPSAFFEDMDINIFWIHYIENEVEKLFRFIKDNSDYKFSSGYISEKVWKSIINYISIKYIAIGKAVYNCTMQDIHSGKEELRFGEIEQKYSNGITSFMYELTKAEETLQRELSVNVAFAANYLANATVSLDEETAEKNDFLTLDDDKLKKFAVPGIAHNIMQFFGGYSAWKDFCDSNFTVDYDELSLLKDMKDIIYSLRNSSFHFATENVNNGSWNMSFIGKMFENDCFRTFKVIRNRFYSSNLPMYYSDTSLEKVLKRLYGSYYERASQVSAFNSVFVRKNFPECLIRNGYKASFDTDADVQKWQNAVYFLFKEIYYNDFLQGKRSLELFLDYVNNLKIEKDEKGKTTKETKPAENFKAAVRHYSNADISLSELCQQIMTEYNHQNQSNVGGKKQSHYAEKMHPKKFQHYKMALLEGLRQSFMTYLMENEDHYGFIKHPVKKPDGLPDIDKFLPEFRSDRFAGIIAIVKTSPELQKWYVLGRLINLRQVNLFAGDLRHYQQYVNNILRRAEETGNAIKDYNMTIDIVHILEILDICTKLNGTTSNEISDYFRDEDEYSEYVGKYLDYGNEKSSVALRAFCNQEISGKKIGIYYDGLNPIVNRNVVLCKMYGMLGPISAKLDPVNIDMISSYMNQQDKIAGYQKNGICRNEEEQKTLKKYQELKNRVELRDIVEYSEILNELQGQLIKWVYLRERDLMYFQLGFHYCCLNNDSYKPDGYACISTDGKTLNGAILYQIVSMYTNGLKQYYKNEDTDYISSRYNFKKNKVIEGTTNANESIGVKIKYFLSYGNGLDPDRQNYGGKIYLSGMEIFENIAEHDNMVELRRYIEHFAYFNKYDRSMLSIYSEIFDRFLSYDFRLRKNVINMMYNILLSHQVVTAYTFESGEKSVGKEKNIKKPSAYCTLREKNGVDSDKYVYKLKDSTKPTEIPARSKDFLNNVARIISYPDDIAVEVVRSSTPMNGSKDSQAHTGNTKGKRELNFGKPKSNNSRFGSSIGDLLNLSDIKLK